MRKLVITENITVDGVIDMAGDWFDPLAGDAEIAAVMAEHQQAADALLVGRNTFEAFREFWPQQTGSVSEYLDAVAKYVVSSTLDEPDWQNTTVLRGDLAAEVRALKAADGRDIVATGSIRLVQALVAERLVDEYRLFVYPVVVGRGARLFEGADLGLRLLDARPFPSGVALVRYAYEGRPR
jgi:dihydrofolate reductase